MAWTYGSQWRKVRAQVLRGKTQCELPWCKYPGVPLDFNTSRTHPLHPTVDHILQVRQTEGWSDAERNRVLLDPTNLRPAHNACNAARNQNPQRRPPRRRTSRSWGV